MGACMRLLSSRRQQQQQTAAAGSAAGASTAQAESYAAQQPAAAIGTFPGRQGPPQYTGMVTLTSAGAFPDMTDGGRRLLRQHKRYA